MDSYRPNLVPIKFRDLDPKELRLRSPIYWLKDIAKPTYIIEGMGQNNSGSGNIFDFQKLCDSKDKENANPKLQCIAAVGYQHYSVLPAVTRTIAARMVMVANGIDFALRADEFKR